MMKPATTIISPKPTTSFEDQVRVALERVRAAMRNVVGSLLGKHDVRAADLVEALTIDTRLAWKMVKIMSVADPLAVVKYLPGERGVRLFLQAAARRDASRSSIQTAREAFAALDEFVRQEAGDRQSFGMMVAGHTPDTDDDAGLEHRKGAFEHNGYIWGVQARTQIHSYLIQPADDGAHLDIAVVRGFVDLRRLRPQIPWRISRFYSINEAGQVRGEFAREPLDPHCAADQTPLLRPFCSQPLPSVRRLVGPQGVIDYVLAESDVGNTQSVTCLTGEVIRRAEPCYADEQNTALGTLAPLRTPCELVVMDVFLHHGFFGHVTPTLRLFSDMFNETLGAHYSDADLLPCPCHMERLSDGPQVPPIRELAKYGDLIRYSFERLAWNPAQFSCYRVRLAFPPVPAALVVDYPLPQRPSA